MSVDILPIIKEYGPWAVFAGAFLEGELVLITAAILASQGMLNIESVWVGAFLGAWTGHLFWFLAGRVFGTRYLLTRLKRYATQIGEVNRMILKHPKTAIFALQYLYGMRVIGAAGLGTSDLAFTRFAFYEAVNCMIWALVVLSAGWFLGETFVYIFKGWLRWVWLGFSLLIFLLFFHHIKSIIYSKMDIRHNRD